MLKSEPRGCRIWRSYVLRESYGYGRLAVVYLATFLSQRSLMITPFMSASFRALSASSRCLTNGNAPLKTTDSVENAAAEERDLP